jgi:hypothetical protein
LVPVGKPDWIRWNQVINEARYFLNRSWPSLAAILVLSVFAALSFGLAFSVLLPFLHVAAFLSAIGWFAVAWLAGYLAFLFRMA